MEIDGIDDIAANSSEGGVWNRKNRMGTYLVWEDLSVVVANLGNSPPRKLLKGLSGYEEPGRIMAIMGPSGSGKSTLLDSLAGRLAGNTIMTGSVLMNGKKKSLNYGVLAYVTQEDVLLGTLTVRETITYSALLRLPDSLSKEEVNEVVEETIFKMGLEDCADKRIGNWHLRGISGGEKKRLSIALEILTGPHLLFLDEPTTGLDSAAAFFVMQTLRNIACDGKTVISSIHQPSSEVFELFDDLFLLSGGEAIYFGEAQMAANFFSEAGFPCPSKRNPSDHFLRCINTDFDIITAALRGSLSFRAIQASSDPLMNMASSEINKILIEKYKTSEYGTNTRRRIRELSCIEGPVIGSNRGSDASWWRQLSTLTRRSLSNMSRDLGYYWIRIIIYIVVSLGVGTMYFDVGTSFNAIMARGNSAAFIVGFMTFLSVGGFPSFIEEMKVFYRERLNGHYGNAVFILSNFLSSFPFLLAVSLFTGSITFYMVKFHPGFSNLLFTYTNLLSCIGTVEGIMMVVASLVPNYLMGVIVGIAILGIMNLDSGFFRLLPDLPKLFWRYPMSYISYTSWSLQGQYKNDLIGLEFDPFIPGGPKLKGETIITTMFGIPMDHSKWMDLTAVFIILISCRLLFFVILKFRERTSPLFHTIFTKKILQQLNRRPSFNRKPSTIKRQPSFPLSYQEGLSSPLP
ncbi:PREDICTED: ABC transporter G family member 15-like [Nelumbo nucifera]|uniref:ABC transporter domain-containing protein n=2 Tax=Nelumbo nucifera TaxID=4432 RepID=A0A822Y6M7_NELNU|nr:PREDICTED: ABC transporter G family member 15-like [Nelumbo nucifera]DAD29644.1 TPA_asm: hypothetical protein HUJ06_031112 [Nelumbo nucifera]